MIVLLENYLQCTDKPLPVLLIVFVQQIQGLNEPSLFGREEELELKQNHGNYSIFLKFNKILMRMWNAVAMVFFYEGREGMISD